MSKNKKIEIHSIQNHVSSFHDILKVIRTNKYSISLVISSTIIALFRKAVSRPNKFLILSACCSTRLVCSYWKHRTDIPSWNWHNLSLNFNYHLFYYHITLPTMLKKKEQFSIWQLSFGGTIEWAITNWVFA